MNGEGLIRTSVAMGTLVTIQVVRPGAESAIGRAFEWFHQIEACCSRFRSDSELMQLAATSGVAVQVSPILFEAVRFALLVAEETGGAFDPTVGHRMEERGFNREHRSGEVIRSPYRAPSDASYRDVQLDPERQTITLLRPLTLDLGAVAKGLAVDTASRELLPFADFAIDAGGDLYLGGSNSQGAPWSVGIRHPRGETELLHSFSVTNQAVCTSGDYERGDHIMDPRPGGKEPQVISATVVAPGAMLADALATAAYVLGPDEGIELLERHGVDGLIVTSQLERHVTRGLRCVA